MDNKLPNKIAIVVITLIFVAGVYLVYTYLPVHVDWVINGPPQIGVDWKLAFRDAAQKMINGKSPYQGEFYNPPWTLLPLIPIALLSPALGSAVMYVLNLACYLAVAAKLKINIWLIVIFVLFSGMLLNSSNGNIEGLIAIGFILPPQVGLFFALAKPQMGIAVAVYWAVDAWRTGGVQKLVRVFAPITIAYSASFILFGWYIKSGLTEVWWNASIFPRGIPIGLILLMIAVWRRNIKFAIAASPFFAPYLAPHTWAIVWLGALSLVSQVSQNLQLQPHPTTNKMRETG